MRKEIAMSDKFTKAVPITQTLEENFDIAVDGAVEVDFQQFSGIIDLVGGVTVEVLEDFSALDHKWACVL